MTLITEFSVSINSFKALETMLIIVLIILHTEKFSEWALRILAWKFHFLFDFLWTLRCFDGYI